MSGMTNLGPSAIRSNAQIGCRLGLRRVRADRKCPKRKEAPTSWFRTFFFKCMSMSQT